MAKVSFGVSLLLLFALALTCVRSGAIDEFVVNEAFKSNIQSFMLAFMQTWTAATGKNDKYFVSALRKIKMHYPLDTESVVCDALWVLDLQCDAQNDPVAKRATYSIVKIINNFGLVSAGMLLERLEGDGLNEAQLVADYAAFQKKIIRINTALFYKQQKFNLIRECNEGYAAFTMLAFYDAMTNISQSNEEAMQLMMLEAKRVIGLYRLDPNKCLDILIDAVSVNLAEKYALLKAFVRAYCECTSSNVAGYLCNKSKNFENEQNKSNLIRLAAMLLRDGMARFEDLLAYFVPHYIDGRESVLKAHAEAGTKSIGCSFSLIVSGTFNSLNDFAEGSDDALINGECPSKISILPVPLWEKHPPLVLLVRFLLEYDFVDEALSIVGQFAEVAEFLLVNAAFANFLLKEISAAYDFARESFEFEKSPFFGSFDAFKNKVDVFMQLLICDLGCHPMLFSLIIKIADWRMKIFAAVSATDAEKQNESLYWFDFCQRWIFPSVLCSPTPNFAAVSCFFDVLKSHFDFKTRYFLFNYVKSPEYCARNTKIKRFYAMVTSETKKVLRRLSKDNTKQVGRALGKLSLINPFAVFAAVIDQIIAYDNLIVPLSDAMKYLSALSSEVLVFSLLDSLVASKKDRLKADGTNISDWLQNIATFVGFLFKKHPALHLRPVLEYVVNQLKSGNAFDLVILTELLFKMSGSDAGTNLSAAQLDALAAGPLLKNEVFSMGVASTAASAAATTKNTKRSSARLVNSLAESQLLVPLWIGIGRVAKSLLFDAKITHLKLLASLVDQSAQILVQFTDLFASNRSLLTLFPCSDELVNNFQINREITSLLARSSKNSTWECSDFFQEAFWKLDLQDVYCPVERYNAEIQRLKSLLLFESRFSGTQETPKDDAAHKKTKEIERLEKEFSERQTHVALVETRCLNVLITPQNESLIASFADPLCIILDNLIPRAKFSTIDAIFCEKLIGICHQRLAIAVDFDVFLQSFFDCVTKMLFSFTECESQNICKPVIKCLSLLAQSPKHSSEAGREALYSFYRAITEIYVAYFASGEFMKIRNSILLLTGCAEVFPHFVEDAEKLENVVKVLKKDAREDVKLLATRYASIVAAVKPNLVRYAAYHPPNEEEIRSMLEAQLRLKAENDAAAALVAEDSHEPCESGEIFPLSIETNSAATEIQPKINVAVSENASNEAVIEAEEFAVSPSPLGVASPAANSSASDASSASPSTHSASPLASNSPKPIFLESKVRNLTQTSEHTKSRTQTKNLDASASRSARRHDYHVFKEAADGAAVSHKDSARVFYPPRHALDTNPLDERDDRRKRMKTAHSVDEGPRRLDSGISNRFGGEANRNHRSHERDRYAERAPPSNYEYRDRSEDSAGAFMSDDRSFRNRNFVSRSSSQGASASVLSSAPRNRTSNGDRPASGSSFAPQTQNRPPFAESSSSRKNSDDGHEKSLSRRHPHHHKNK